MSIWQFFAALNGHIQANSPKAGEKLTEAEAEDLFDWIMSDAGGPRIISTQTYWWEGEQPVPAGIVTFTVDQ